MARTGLFHHVGTFFLFAAAILLLITTISAPVVNDISIMKVRLPSNTDPRLQLDFGTFGYCTVRTGDDSCSGKHIGYDPAAIVRGVAGEDFGIASSKSTKALTNVMVLHPVACGLAFIAFLFSAGSGICGALLASFVAAIAWIVTLVVMAIDFVIFGIIKHHVNKNGNTAHAKYGPAMWTCLVAMILLFFATFIVLFTCLSSRRHRNDTRNVKHADAGYANGPVVARRHFWQRRTRATY